MATTLLQADAGQGKTAHILRLLNDYTREQPLAQVWILLATDRQIHDFRRRLLALDPTRRTHFNLHFFNFYSLYTHLLDMAGQPQRCIDEAARLRLLRSIIAQMVADGRLPVFDRIAHTRGFVRIAADFIYELKQHLVTPGDFWRAVRSPKDEALAGIYDRYQETVQQHDLVDREGEGWLSLLALHSDERLALDVDLLIVDGYDQFTLVQAHLIAALASRIRTWVTLTQPTVDAEGRSLVARLVATRERLLRVHHDTAVTIDPVWLARESSPDQPPHADITALIDGLSVRRPPQSASGAALHFLEAPSPAEEAAEIMRRVKRLLLDGIAPDTVLIALRNWQGYADHLISAAHTFELAAHVAFQYAEPLADNPAIHALLNLLTLPSSDWRRRDLLDVLRSPYFEFAGLAPDWVDKLERISLRLFITGGKADWLEGIRTAQSTLTHAEDDAPDQAGFGTLLTPDEADHLDSYLTLFFNRLELHEQGSLQTHVNWLENLIGPDPEANPDDENQALPDVSHIGMIRAVRRGALRPGIVERDLAALDKLKSILRSLLSAQALARALGHDEQMDWSAFLNDLIVIIEATTVERAPSRDGRVLVTSVTDARGLPHTHVFIPGLAEGDFPARTPEDPLYLDSERRALRVRGIPLPTAADRADDDGLFYELVSLAKGTLTLSRPYLKDGAPLPASHLWRAARRTFSNADALTTRLPIGGVTAQPASLPEAALALAHHLNLPMLEAGAAGWYGWFMDDEIRRAYWERIAFGRRIERRRMSARFAYDRYSGQLQSPELIAWVADRLNRRHLWSASQLNEYGTCPYNYFARRLLRLEPLEEPDEGMDSRQLGTLYHHILESTYRVIAQRALPITAEHVETALGILREQARAWLRQAPHALGFRATPLWTDEQRILLRKLEALVRADFDDEGSPAGKLVSGERITYRVEAPFGGESGMFIVEAGGETLRIYGKIDRIDLAGGRAVVIDYKAGSTPISVDELRRGRNFQMMLYLLAARDLLQVETAQRPDVAAGIFWSIGTQKALGTLDAHDDEQVIEDARRHLADYVTRARAGDFRSRPNKLEEGKCSRYCAFFTLCRVSAVSRHKPAAGDTP